MSDGAAKDALPDREVNPEVLHFEQSLLPCDRTLGMAERRIRLQSRFPEMTEKSTV
jgi:hypothetical protein